jgi:hypothetical protein
MVVCFLHRTLGRGFVALLAVNTVLDAEIPLLSSGTKTRGNFGVLFEFACFFGFGNRRASFVCLHGGLFGFIFYFFPEQFSKALEIL